VLGGPLAQENPIYLEADDVTDPFELDVDVRCEGLSEGSIVALRVLCTDPQCVDAAPQMIELDTEGFGKFVRVALAEGDNRLTLTSDVESSGTPKDSSQQTDIIVTVDTGRCTARLFPLDGTVLLADQDTDSVSGMQAVVDLVTGCHLDSEPHLYVQGEECVSAGTAGQCFYQSMVREPLMPSDETRFRFFGVQLPESTAAFDVSVFGTVEEPIEVGGKFGVTIPHRYWVDSDRPSLQNVFPVEGACYIPSDDADTTQPGFQLATGGAVLGADVNGEVWLRTYQDGEPEFPCAEDVACAPMQSCRGGLCRYVASVVGGNFARLITAEPGHDDTIELVALDNAGNRSLQITQAITVAPAEPSAQIVMPLADSTLNILEDDADLVSDGFQVELKIDVQDVPEPVNLQVSAVGMSTVDVPLVADPESVSVFMNMEDGAQSVTLHTQNECGDLVALLDQPFQFVTLATIRTPALRAYGAGKFGGRWALSDDSDTSESSIDLDVLTGISPIGLTRALSVRVTDAFTIDTDGRTCTGAELSTSDDVVAPDAEGAMVSGIALQAGINCLEVNADDGELPLAETLVLRQVPPPQVRFTDPDPAASPVTLTVDSSVGVPGHNHSLGLEMVSADGGRGRVQLSRNGLVLAGVYLTPPSTMVALSDFGIPEGTAAWRVSYVDRFGNESVDLINGGTGTNESLVDTTVDSSAGVDEPQIVIEQPTWGAELQNICGGSDPDCGDLTVTVRHLGGDEPTSCDLFVLSDAAAVAPTAVATLAWVPSASTLVFDSSVAANPLVPEAAPRFVRMECTSGSGIGVAPVVPFVVDETGPGGVSLMDGNPGAAPIDFSTPGYEIDSTAQDESYLLGLQHSVLISMPTGGELVDGWMVELEVTQPSGTVATYRRELTDDGINPTLVTFKAVDFGTQEGGTDYSQGTNITFSAVVKDKAGNASTPTAVTLSIDLTKP
jgi:hypothetical protein